MRTRLGSRPFPVRVRCKQKPASRRAVSRTSCVAHAHAACRPGKRERRASSGARAFLCRWSFPHGRRVAYAQRGARRTLSSSRLRFEVLNLSGLLTVRGRWSLPSPALHWQRTRELLWRTSSTSWKARVPLGPRELTLFPTSIYSYPFMENKLALIGELQPTGKNIFCKFCSGCCTASQERDDRALQDRDVGGTRQRAS